MSFSVLMKYQDDVNKNQSKWEKKKCVWPLKTSSCEIRNKRLWFLFQIYIAKKSFEMEKNIQVLLFLCRVSFGKTLHVHPFKYLKKHSLTVINRREKCDPTSNMLPWYVADSGKRLEMCCIMVRNMDSVDREHGFKFWLYYFQLSSYACCRLLNLLVPQFPHVQMEMITDWTSSGCYKN